MKQLFWLVQFLFTILAISSCSNQSKVRGKNQPDENPEIAKENVVIVNTNKEIEVYNDFIDEVYRIYYCHLEMDSPEEYLLYNDDKKITKEEITNYKKKWNLYMKSYNEMIDTSKIIAFVDDSLYSLKMPSQNSFGKLDSIQRLQFHDLLADTIVIKSATFILDSLKSKKIHFERPPYIHFDWDKIPIDSALKYSDQNEKYWFDHVGHQVGNKYYIGAISMSRVKFNQDSTLCLLECGYMAQSKCGYGHYYLLKRKNKKWTIVTTSQSWVS